MNVHALHINNNQNPSSRQEDPALAYQSCWAALPTLPTATNHRERAVLKSFHLNDHNLGFHLYDLMFVCESRV